MATDPHREADRNLTSTETNVPKQGPEDRAQRPPHCHQGKPCPLNFFFCKDSHVLRDRPAGTTKKHAVVNVNKNYTKSCQPSTKSISLATIRRTFTNSSLSGQKHRDIPILLRAPFFDRLLRRTLKNLCDFPVCSEALRRPHEGTLVVSAAQLPRFPICTRGADHDTFLEALRVRDFLHVNLWNGGHPSVHRSCPQALRQSLVHTINPSKTMFKPTLSPGQAWSTG